jgi:hypothetical protein
MTIVTFDNNKVILKGHSMYGKYGHDIVCAAISSISQFTAEIIKSEKLGDYYIKNKETENVELTILYDNSEFSKKLINYMMEAVKNIEKKHPGNVKVEVKNK